MNNGSRADAEQTRIQRHGRAIGDFPSELLKS